MENKIDQRGKNSIYLNKTEEQQKGIKQMLGFEDVNFEQKREPYYQNNTYTSRNTEENQERSSGRRN